MNLLSVLSSVSAPKSLWVTLINWIQSSVGNFGWTIILVTVLIKLVTSPLDFWVKFNTKNKHSFNKSVHLKLQNFKRNLETTVKHFKDNLKHSTKEKA